MKKNVFFSWLSSLTSSSNTIGFDKKSFYLLGSICFLNWLFLFFDIYLWEFSWQWFLVILLSPFLGIAGIYAVAFFLHGICKFLFKGTATFSQVLASYGWAQLPLVINVLMWLLLILFDFRGFLALRPGGITSFIFVNLIILISLSWSLALLFKGLKEVENFSSVKTIFSILLLLPIYLLVIFFYNFIAVFVFAFILLI